MILTLAASAAFACIGPVVDGNTVRLCTGEKVHVANIEAPEAPGSRACRKASRDSWCDERLSEKSRRMLEAFLASGAVVMTREGLSHRATFRVDGQDVGQFMVARGLARYPRVDGPAGPELLASK